MTKIIRDGKIYMHQHTDGWIYILELSDRRGHGEQWSRMPVEPTAPDHRITKISVPLKIRREARAHFGIT